MEENKRYGRNEAWKYYINQEMLNKALKKCGIMFVFGVALQYISSFLLTIYLEHNAPLAENYSELMQGFMGDGVTLIMVIFIGVITPIMEEVVYRGLIMTVCNLFLPFFVGNIIQALIFGYSHGNIVQSAYAFLLGLLIGGMIKITGSFFYGIFLHMGVNIFGLFIDKYVPESTSFAMKVLYFIISIVVGAICVYLLIILKNNKNISFKVLANQEAK